METNEKTEFETPTGLTDPLKNTEFRTLLKNQFGPMTRDLIKKVPAMEGLEKLIMDILPVAADVGGDHDLERKVKDALLNPSEENIEALCSEPRSAFLALGIINICGSDFLTSKKIRSVREALESIPINRKFVSASLLEEAIPDKKTFNSYFRALWDKEFGGKIKPSEIEMLSRIDYDPQKVSLTVIDPQLGEKLKLDNPEVSLPSEWEKVVKHVFKRVFKPSKDSEFNEERFREYLETLCPYFKKCAERKGRVINGFSVLNGYPLYVQGVQAVGVATLFLTLVSEDDPLFTEMPAGMKKWLEDLREQPIPTLKMPQDGKIVLRKDFPQAAAVMGSVVLNSVIDLSKTEFGKKVLKNLEEKSFKPIEPSVEEFLEFLSYLASNPDQEASTQALGAAGLILGPTILINLHNEAFRFKFDKEKKAIYLNELGWGLEDKFPYLEPIRSYELLEELYDSYLSDGMASASEEVKKLQISPSSGFPFKKEDFLKYFGDPEPDIAYRTATEFPLDREKAATFLKEVFNAIGSQKWSEYLDKVKKEAEAIKDEKFDPANINSLPEKYSGVNDKFLEKFSQEKTFVDDIQILTEAAFFIIGDDWLFDKMKAKEINQWMAIKNDWAMFFFLMSRLNEAKLPFDKKLLLAQIFAVSYGLNAVEKEDAMRLFSFNYLTTPIPKLKIARGEAAKTLHLPMNKALKEDREWLALACLSLPGEFIEDWPVNRGGFFSFDLIVSFLKHPLKDRRAAREEEYEEERERQVPDIDPEDLRQIIKRIPEQK